MALTSEQYALSSNLTASGVVGTSGSATAIIGITIKGGSATTRAVVYDGTDANGTLREDAIAPINNTVYLYYGPKGAYYINGVYMAITTTAGSVTFTYLQ